MAITNRQRGRQIRVFLLAPAPNPPHLICKAVGRALGPQPPCCPRQGQAAEAIETTREMLGVPADYRIGIVPASDTGAFEMAMWSLLGERPAEMVAWESFGAGWVTDVVKQLKIDATAHTADYGEIVDMAALNYDNDVCFTWNGTTSGVRVANGDADPCRPRGSDPLRCDLRRICAWTCLGTSWT